MQAASPEDLVQAAPATGPVQVAPATGAVQAPPVSQTVTEELRPNYMLTFEFPGG